MAIDSFNKNRSNENRLSLNLAMQRYKYLENKLIRQVNIIYLLKLYSNYLHNYQCLYFHECLTVNLQTSVYSPITGFWRHPQYVMPFKYEMINLGLPKSLKHYNVYKQYQMAIDSFNKNTPITGFWRHPQYVMPFKYVTPMITTITLIYNLSIILEVNFNSYRCVTWKSVKWFNIKWFDINNYLIIFHLLIIWVTIICRKDFLKILMHRTVLSGVFYNFVNHLGCVYVTVNSVPRALKISTCSCRTSNTSQSYLRWRHIYSTHII
jgi:hypothetical protein